MSVKEYIAKDTFKFNKKKVQIYGRELDRIRVTSGRLTPKNIIEAARSPKNPLHECFNWNDTDAAEKWRRYQARQLINGIEVKIVIKEDKKSKSVNVRAWTFSNKKRAYEDIEIVLKEPHEVVSLLNHLVQQLTFWEEETSKYFKIARIIHKAKKEIAALQRKYNAKRIDL